MDIFPASFLEEIGKKIYNGAGVPNSHLQALINYIFMIIVLNVN